MAIQLANIPAIKINGEELEGYVFLEFKMTKRLLEPNCFEFVFRKEDMTLTQDDIKFELREKLLGALVECSVSVNRYDTEGEWQVDEVDNFFRGYIQHIRLERENMKAPMRVQCTAYSADSRLKQYPRCDSYLNELLEDCVGKTLAHVAETPMKFSPDSGFYSTEAADFKKLEMEIHPRNNTVMPYTVQYNESDYDFLKRLAKRYGEFFYYENGKVVFGDMLELEPVTLRTGIDLEQYDYDLNTNQHTGIVFSGFDYSTCNTYLAGWEKGDRHIWKNEHPHIHEMSKSVYEHATEYFNDYANSVADCCSARIDQNTVPEIDEDTGITTNGDDIDIWVRNQRRIYEQYVMADTMLCSGKARRADLKLGSVIIIEDETNTGDTATDFVQHEPLKVIDLTYIWSGNSSRTLENSFKAIPQKSAVPPYLKRDEQGFLTYGDFDIYPKCGPQTGRVLSNKDPRHLGRVQVVLEWQFAIEFCVSKITQYLEVESHSTPWIRVAQPYGGFYRGSYLVPEEGDEVIVGFERNNAERPYVMASVHNGRGDAPVKEWTEEDSVENNEYKAIRTRNGHTIEIRDKGEHGYIKIYDENTRNYVVTYDTDNKVIRLESKGNIELSADRNIVLNAGNNIIMEAKNDINSHAENDIQRVADHNIDDGIGNNYINKVGNDYMAYIDEANTHIHMVRERVQMQLDDEKKLVRVDEIDGVIIHSDNMVAVVSQDQTGIHGKNKLTVQSDNTTVVKAMQINVDGDADVNIKGSMVKIN